MLPAEKRAILSLLCNLLINSGKSRRRRRMFLLFSLLNNKRGLYLMGDSSVSQQLMEGDEDATKEHLRINTYTLTLLEREIGRTKHHGYEMKFECIVFLFWLAAGISYRVTGASLGVPRQTVFDIIKRMICRFIRVLAPRIVSLPKTRQELQAIGEGFQRKSGGNLVFSTCVGAIDGVHVRLTVPSGFEDQYINRKLFYSLNCQALVDDTGKFIDFYAGFPGSVHDTRMLRHSQLYRRGEYPPEGFFIIGDGGYPCLSNPITLITPYSPNPNQLQRRFNYALNKARNQVERSFGMMKSRWRQIFLKALEVKVRKAVDVIVCCTIMHNICITAGDIMDPQIDEEDDEIPEGELRGAENTGQRVRDILLVMFQEGE